MLEYFRYDYSFVENYFTKLIELTKEGKRKFPQAIIFEGADTKHQFLFALELARILNCKNNGERDCNCINCKWIRTHSHPEVNYVSQIHSKGENDETKTVISVKQALEIEKNLTLSSDCHRFFIFFSSKNKTWQDDELKDFKELGYSDVNYSIEGIDHTTFHPNVPNALLKSIEEPPEKTTFVFLTESKENILPTIVSRCIIFKISSKKPETSYKEIESIVSSYPDISYTNALEISEKLLNLINDNLTSIDMLNKFIAYLAALLKNNINNSKVTNKINNDINIVNHAIKSIKANVSEKIAIENMMLKIARGY